MKIGLARAIYELAELYLIDDDIILPTGLLRKIVNYILNNNGCVLQASDNISVLE